ncbi:MAG: mandelate racemase [Acidobacteria bacterium]|nr:mandelate racemase [Acidobacteriota bacterium]
MTDARIDSVRATAYRIPTEAPESDGTYEWDSTTMVCVEVDAGGRNGFGYSYADVTAASIVNRRFADLLRGHLAMDIEAAWRSMSADLRNIGRPGIGAHAVSAVDTALWDLKAKLLDQPLVTLLGQVRDAVPAYGSGGFTSLDEKALQRQLSDWVADGFTMVKMKVGRAPHDDPKRVTGAKKAIGTSCALMVDANGALSRHQAVAAANRFAESNVVWFEEPVSSDDREGLRWVRSHAPMGMAIAAGEYGYDPWYFAAMLDASSVDILQADATRCLGISGFMKASALCEARHVPLSAHCAPSIHLHAAAASSPLVHVEYFHDHVRIESMLLDGFVAAQDGLLHPPLDRPGHGVALKSADADQWRIA